MSTKMIHELCIVTLGIIFVQLYPTLAIASQPQPQPHLLNNQSFAVLFPDADPIPLLYYKFVMFWPHGYCKLNKKAPCHHNTQLPQRFTIHGLWVINPFSDKSRSPVEFNDTLLDDLKPLLYEYWPSINEYAKLDNYGREISEKASIDFWKHEWRNHGQVDPGFKFKFVEYFQRAIAIFEELDIDKILLVKPNTPESLKELLSATGTQVTPMLRCTSTGPYYLTEIIFCLESSATQYVDCPPPKNIPDTKECKAQQSFLY